jgi:hypothetical protein
MRRNAEEEVNPERRWYVAGVKAELPRLWPGSAS